LTKICEYYKNAINPKLEKEIRPSTHAMVLTPLCPTNLNLNVRHLGPAPTKDTMLSSQALLVKRNMQIIHNIEAVGASTFKEYQNIIKAVGASTLEEYQDITRALEHQNKSDSDPEQEQDNWERQRDYDRSRDSHRSRGWMMMMDEDSDPTYKPWRGCHMQD
jgi:hypothetical protein